LFMVYIRNFLFPSFSSFFSFLQIGLKVG
jgi:hypothetical protein